MPVATAFVYNGNEATFRLAEGSWTDDDRYREGGYFADQMRIGMVVSLTDTDYMVTKSTAGATPVGILKSITGGRNITNGRVGMVKLFGGFIEEVEIHTASAQILPGQSVAFSTSGGSSGCGLWVKAAAGNNTMALAGTPASGSIVAGTKIPILFGAVKY